MKKIFLFVLALVFLATVSAFASDNDLAYKGITELESITTAESGDLIPVYDASTDNVKKMDATNPAVSGDVTFRTSLIAAGRVNAASTVASSSTNLAPASLPYMTILKAAGGAGGLDLTDGGTRLPNGLPGQILVLQLEAVMTGGSWVVTPTTKYGFDYITFDAVGERVTLLYVDDTLGWAIISSEGATITFKTKGFVQAGFIAI